MSESVRSPQLVAVEYAPFPLDRENGRTPRTHEGPRGLWALKLTRLLHWSLAFARQKAILLTRPLICVLAGLEVFWRAAGETLWRLLYAAAALTDEAAWSLHAAAAGLAGRLSQHWYQSRSRLRHSLCKRVTLACLFTGVSLCLIAGSFYTLGLEVFLGGEPIGFVSSSAEFDRAVADVSRRAGEILHYPYNPNPDVTYRYAVVDRSSVFDQAQVEDQLFGQIANIKRLNVLTVDGAVAAVSFDKAGLEAILDGLLNANDLGGTAESVAFEQEITISDQWTDAALERPLPEIEAALSASEQPRYDEWGGNETLADIARRNGMSEEALRALNNLDDVGGADGAAGFPDDPDGAAAAETQPRMLLVQKAMPFLTVDASLHRQYEEEIPYTSVTAPDDTIYVGETRLRTQGVPGTALVTVRQVYQNGEAYQTVEEDRETILAPVQEVIAEGTKERPAKAPTGTFVYPYYGRLTSPFGYRSLFGGEMHTGIDLAGPAGSPIVAADGGVVIMAGWNGGYGNCVMISHGNGVTTLYGHCSKLLVTEGQAVAKGELIARVGSTGRSTGPHVHFEIRIDGTPVNPLKYLD